MTSLIALRITLVFLVIIVNSSKSLINFKYALNINSIGMIPFSPTKSLIILIAIWKIASVLVSVL